MSIETDKIYFATLQEAADFRSELNDRLAAVQDSPIFLQLKDEPLQEDDRYYFFIYPWMQEYINE